MQLSPSIQAYFDASAMPAGEPPLAAFAPDAVVIDEGASRTGHAAIAAWWRAAKARYRHTAQPRAIEETGGPTVVRAEVTGDFPGSPVELRFVFRLDGGRIAALEIAP